MVNFIRNWLDRNKVVGHKTMADGTHTPLTRKEADALWKVIEANNRKRVKAMPTERAALEQFHSAYVRLKELGWRDIHYCPKDGRTFQVIEVGSTGVHVAHYESDGHIGTFWIHAEGDLWPSKPSLYRPLPAEGNKNPIR